MVEGRTAEAVEFLRRWGVWCLTAIRPDDRDIETRTFADEREAARWIEARQGERNIYFSVNRPRGSPSRKVTKAGIEAMLALHVDVDPETGIDIEVERRRIEAALLGCEPKPSVVVFSGGGYQGYWLLREPVGVSADNLGELEGYNIRVERELGADHCHNIDRIMRLPGTVNVPDRAKLAKGRRPELARVVWADWDMRYEIRGFRSTPRGDVPWTNGSTAWPRGELPERVRELIATGDAGRWDGDRSAAVWYACCQMVRSGWDDAQIAATIADPANGISAHVREQSNVAAYAARQAARARAAVGSPDWVDQYDEGYERSLQAIAGGGNVVSMDAAKTKRTKQGRPPPSDQSRPVIRVMAGETPRVVDQSERAMLRAGDCGVYSFGPRLVQVGWTEVRVSGGGKERMLRNCEVNEAAITERFELAARYEKWLKTEKDWVTCDCPEKVAKTYLSRKQWGVRSLLGISTIPIFRADGSVWSTPGYDPVSGAFYDPLGVRFMEVSDRPTRAEAEKALRSLLRLIRTFEFVSNADRSVALSALMTPVLRKAMPAAPLHAFDAPTAGSGKSMLTNVASIVATGHRAAAMATGGDRFSDNEFEKRLAAALLGGADVISIDNVEEPLGGQLLNSMLTEHTIEIRIFGQLKSVKVPSGATVFANGNNLVLIGDLTRRALVGRFDPKVERPETREFRFEPVDLASRARPYLVWCVMTIARAWLTSGERISAALGSYREWGELVRKPLMWLGEADPVGVMERTREADPRLSKLRTMMAAWAAAIGPDTGVRAKQVIVAASRTLDYDDGDRRQGDLVWPDLSDAVRSVAGQGDGVSPDKLGWWLKKNVDRTVIVDDVVYKFTQVPSTQGAIWELRRLGEARAPQQEEMPF